MRLVHEMVGGGRKSCSYARELSDPTATKTIRFDEWERHLLPLRRKSEIAGGRAPPHHDDRRAVNFKRAISSGTRRSDRRESCRAGT
jgi:hypothetical protein